MNTSLIQTLLTIVSGIMAAAIPILLSMGCTTSPVTGAIDCAAANAPTWLVPYLGAFVVGLNLVKVIISTVEGKFKTPTVAVPKGTEAVIVPKSPSQ